MTKNLAVWLRTPPTKWEALAAKSDLEAVWEADNEAAELAVHLARLSAYISRRHNGGKHADAVKRQNEVARKVRQALGYTYADDKITF